MPYDILYTYLLLYYNKIDAYISVGNSCIVSEQRSPTNLLPLLLMTVQTISITQHQAYINIIVSNTDMLLAVFHLSRIYLFNNHCDSHTRPIHYVSMLFITSSFVSCDCRTTLSSSRVDQSLLPLSRKTVFKQKNQQRAFADRLKNLKNTKITQYQM